MTSDLWHVLLWLACTGAAYVFLDSIMSWLIGGHVPADDSDLENPSKWS